MAPPLSPSQMLAQARATFERLRTPNAGLTRSETPNQDSRNIYHLHRVASVGLCRWSLVDVMRTTNSEMPRSIPQPQASMIVR